MEKTEPKYLIPAGSGPCLMYPPGTEDANAATLYEITRIINATYRTEGQLAAMLRMGGIRSAFCEQGIFVDNMLVEPHDERCRFASQVRDKTTGRIVRPPKNADPPMSICCFDPLANQMFRIAVYGDGTVGSVGLAGFADFRVAYY